RMYPTNCVRQRRGCECPCHVFHSSPELASHNACPRVRAKNHTVTGLQQSSDYFSTVVGNGTVGHCRRITFPSRCIEDHFPILLRLLEFLPCSSWGARAIQLRSPDIPHAFFAHSI